MRIRPKPFVIPASGDPFVNDTLGRRTHIEALTELVRNMSGPCVLAIDGPWGSGKTVFLRLWARFLRSKRFKVAEFNAWETDFGDDPLIALYAALDEVLGKMTTDTSKDVLKKGSILVSALASELPLIPDIADAVGRATASAETSARARLSRHRDAEDAIAAFRRSLVKATRGRLPLVVCVDELDRCRPDYAISFLEAAKHIFNVDGVVFVLAVNLSELAKSVSVPYGSEFDGEVYLRRFVDRTIHLPQADRDSFLADLLQSSGLAQRNSTQLSGQFLEIFVFPNPTMSLRDLEQGVYHLGAVLNSSPRQRFQVKIPFETVAGCLMTLRITSPQTYKEFKRGEINDLQVLERLNGQVGRSVDWWIDSQDSEFSRTNEVFEAILSGWYRHFHDWNKRTSPLLDKRHIQSDDNENSYPAKVRSLAQEVTSDYRWQFDNALSVIELVTYVPPR